ncbi:GFA family protein [soil metagenome]
MDGQCRCGRVKIRIGGPALLTMACHCRGCQRMTASAFSLTVAVPTPGFQVVEGETVPGGLHGASRHEHCAHCMSWVFSRLDGMDHFVNVRTTMLDDPEAYPPFIDTMASEKLSWVTTPARHSYPEFPPIDAFGDLIAEYARSQPGASSE